MSPVPWVAVAIAPATDCAVDVAEVGHGESDRGERVVEPMEADAGLDGHPPALGDRRRGPDRAGRALSCIPSVAAAAVNEWPAPIALTRCPARWAAATIWATSYTDPGVRRSAGTHRWLPAQLRTAENTPRNLTGPTS